MDESTENAPEGRTPPSPYVYQDLNEVPEPWRTHRSARLTVHQVNEIMRRAYEFGYWLEHDDGTAYFVPDEGRAREEFVAQHANENGVWIPKAKA